MAKGQAQAAQNNLNTTNSVAGAQNNKANQLEDTLIPGYESLMDTGYLSPEEEAAATTAEMGSATAPFQTADFEAKDNAAATRNTSDLASQQDALALEEGQTAGSAADELQDQKMQNEETGMYGLNNLESGNLQAMESMYGLGPGTLQARAAGGPPAWESILQSGMTAAGAAGGAAL